MDMSPHHLRIPPPFLSALGCLLTSLAFLSACVTLRDPAPASGPATVSGASADEANESASIDEPSPSSVPEEESIVPEEETLAADEVEPSAAEVQTEASEETSPSPATEFSLPPSTDRDRGFEDAPGGSDDLRASAPDNPGPGAIVSAPSAGLSVLVPQTKVEETPGEGEEAIPPSPRPGSPPVTGGVGGGRRTAPSPPHVRMIPTTPQLEVGNRVSIRVRIVNAVDVGSVPFHVIYNPGVLRFEGAVEGSFLAAGGRATAFFAAPMSNGYEAVVGLSRLGRGDGIGGSGELCILDFTVVGSGDAELAFVRAHVRDSENRIVPAIFEPISLRAD